MIHESFHVSGENSDTRKEKAGSEIIVHCLLETKPGNLSLLKWECDGEELVTWSSSDEQEEWVVRDESKLRRYKLLKESSFALLMSNSTLNDSGRYTCSRHYEVSINETDVEEKVFEVVTNVIIKGSYSFYTHLVSPFFHSLIYL